MTFVAAEVEVEAPPERVWEVVGVPENLPQWDRHIAEVQDVPPGGLREGSVYVTVMQFLGVRTRVPSKVLEWEPPNRAVFRLKGVIDATVTTTVEPLPGERSRLRHEVDFHFRGGLLGEIAARSLAMVGGAQYALRRGAIAQKRQVEEGR